MENNKDIGALWLKTSKDGKEFMSGAITIGDAAHEIVLFKNTFKKEGERTPDWRIYASKPRTGGMMPGPEGDQAQDAVFNDTGEDAIPF